MTTTLSVAICTYLREESLRNLLEDLHNQTVAPDEIIVVDQTPTHEVATNRLLESLGPSLRHYRQSEPNLPAARNEALRLAQSEVVIFVDDDVRVPPGFLADIRHVFDAHGLDGVAPLVTVMGEPPGADVARRYRLKGGWMQRAYIGVDSVIGACFAVRKHTADVLGGFDETLARLHPSASGEDLDFTRRLTRAGFVLALVPGVRVRHETDWPGGCAVRTRTDLTPARRATTYITLKETDSLRRLTLRAVARLIGLYVMRKDVVFSPMRLARVPATLVEDVRAVRNVALRPTRAPVA